MNVVIISDENYAAQSAALLLSFFECNKKESHDIYFITTSVSKNSQNKIDIVCKRYNSNLHYILFDEELLNPFDGIGYWPKYTFMKLFISQVLPKNVSKALYLDVDMLIVDNLENLYSTELGDYAVAGVEDVPFVEPDCKRCCLPLDSVYINSGLMLLNLALWREEWDNNSFYKYVDGHKGKMSINDQDVINSIFNKRIMSLEWRYNITLPFFGLSSPVYKLDSGGVRMARRNPAVIHFTGPKPWENSCCHLYTKQWRDAMNSTPFKRKWHKIPIKIFLKLIVYKIVDFYRIWICSKK